MFGGAFGLETVGTERWGGLPLTVILTLLAMGVSTPLGVLLALARRSNLPLLRSAATAYVELVRGVPLLTVLFVATFVLPLVLPPGWRIDPFWRVTIGLVFFQAAYMAETVRGGLQTLPRGQLEAGTSLGLRYWQLQRAIVLPQALVAVIPAFVNNLLSTFMDTSLVTVVSMYDLTGSLRLALGDPRWRDFFIEGYLFIGSVYFFGSFAMSRYSQWLERRLRPGASR
jgi:general L-amino acid transport system permease protein